MIETNSGGYPHVEVDEVAGVIVFTFSTDKVARTVEYDDGAITIELNHDGNPVTIEILL